MRYVLAVLVVCTGPLSGQQQPSPWGLVARALGKSGAPPGETYRATFPRSDLRVRVGDVAIAPALALTSWAAFAGSADSADVMGDLVLTEREVPVVVSGLLGAGFDVTAIHHHLLGEAPRVLYLHYHGRGTAVPLAARLREVLSRTATPLAEPAVAPRPAPVTLDTAAWRGTSPRSACRRRAARSCSKAAPYPARSASTRRSTSRASPPAGPWPP